MNKIKYIIIIFLALAIFTPDFSYAQTPSKNTSSKTQLEKPEGAGTSKENPLVKCGDGTVLGVDPVTGTPLDACDVDDLNTLMKDIINLVFIFAGFIVAAMFIYAGFLMITASGNMGQIQKAKDIFRRVVIGFLIMFLAYIVIRNLLENIGAEEFFKNLIK